MVGLVLDRQGEMTEGTVGIQCAIIGAILFAIVGPLVQFLIKSRKMKKEAQNKSVLII